MATKKCIISLALVCFFTCAGCSKESEIRYVEKPVYVEIPVATKVEIEPIKKPDYDFLKNINANSTPQEIAECYANTIKRMNSYIIQLEDTLKPFYKKETTDGKF